jgi:hypothetical protein
MLEGDKEGDVLLVCYIMYFNVSVSYGYKRTHHLADIHNRLYSLHNLGMLLILPRKKEKSIIEQTMP